MNSDFIKYSKSSGRVLERGSVPPEMLSIQENETVGIIEITPDLAIELPLNRYYVVQGSLVARPVSPIQQNGTVFSSIPTDLLEPGKVTIEDKEYDLTDSTLEVSFNLPGTYIVKFNTFPYLDTTFTVTV